MAKMSSVISSGRMVKTNIGVVPIMEYADMVASQCGFDDYKDLRNQGYDLNVEDEEVSEDA